MKYATVYATAVNQLGDPVNCTIHHEATRALSVVGPIAAGQNTGKITYENIWYNFSITNVVVHSMEVEYVDGTFERYEHTDYGTSTGYGFCTKCGNKFLNDGNFCVKCGAKRK